MDTLGNVIWTTTNPSPSIPNDLIELANGDIVTLGGNYYISPFHADFYSLANTTVYINKYNNSGTLIGSSQINNPAGVNKQVGYRIIETADQGFVFTGLSDDDIWLVKTDSLGQLSTSISENNQENKFSLYPNPANATCHFSFDREIASITITSLDGEILSSNVVNQKQGILSTNNFADGLYIVMAELVDGRKVFNRLMVVHP
jgi:Secretion system C-terminal sorting domain